MNLAYYMKVLVVKLSMYVGLVDTDEWYVW